MGIVTGLILAINLVTIIILLVLLRRGPAAQISNITLEIQKQANTLSSNFASANADMAARLEQTKGDLRQQITDRVSHDFNEMHTMVARQLAEGRQEQSGRIDTFTAAIEARFDSLHKSTEKELLAFSGKQTESLAQVSSAVESKFDVLSTKQSQSLAEGRQELATVLATTTSELKREFQSLSQKMEQSTEGIRDKVDQKLTAITQQVQQKLDENIKSGFAQFEKVLEHLKSAEEQLRQVGVVGNSINDLNNLLKLPHLRGDFGEGNLEQLLSDFLPTSMYELQSAPGEEGGRADVMINLPGGRLPIDAKFPREQVLPLFESSDEGELKSAREQLVRVMKEQAKRIAKYIQPQSGTAEVALMYLPSETLYFEVIRSNEASDALRKVRVFPVSPNTLMMTLRTIQLAQKWYEVASRFEESRLELGKAQKYLGYFHKQFDKIGTELESAQKAYDTAAKHLKSYQRTVTAISGVEASAVEPPSGEEVLSLAAAGDN